MKIHSYPKVLNLGHAHLANLFNEEVTIEEKVDGSQFSFCRVDEGTVVYRSKNCEIFPGHTDKLFSAAVNYVEGIKVMLPIGYTYRGEVLHSVQHNTIRYGRTPKNNVIIFDIDTGEERFMTYEEKKEEAERIGLETVPIVYHGLVSDYTTLRSFLDRESVLSTDEHRVKLEGIVIKNYKRLGIDGKTVMGKWVREEFKELNGSTFKNANPSNSEVVERIIAIYRSPNRWSKAVQHLRDNAMLTSEPKDIGPLMKEVNLDVLAECEEEIKQKLWEYAWPKIARGITRGLPEWYKDQLAKKQFEGKESAHVQA